ncbi:MAG: glutaredoxin family protein [Acidimicrobiia bacterium]
MNDPLSRLLVVLAVVGVTLAFALAVRRGMAVRRRSVQIDLPHSGVVVFASSGCVTCARLEAELSQAGIADVTVLDWDESPELFLSAHIDRVPTLVSLDAGGTGWMVQGVPSAARLRKWLGGP